MKHNIFITIIKIWLYVVVLSLSATTLLAAPGDLDTTFCDDGIATFSENMGSFTNSVAIQSDEKIVIAGTFDNDFALVRHNTNGTIDTSFEHNPSGLSDYAAANSTAIQSDGKIVAAGYASNGSSYDFALVRYNTDGSIDTSFEHNPSGLSNYAAANSIAIQSDGKIVAAGYASNGSFCDFALVRYNTDGSIDTGFEHNPSGLSDYAAANSIAIQSDGKIVAAGTSSGDFALVRYNTDGTIDNSFEHNPSGLTSYAYASSLAIQPDGKFVAAGGVNNGISSNVALVRYNTDGSIDTSFEFSPTDFTGYAEAYSIAIQPDGKIVIAGRGNADFALARCNTDGSIDDGFGIILIDFGSWARATSVAIQADGKIVVTGLADTGSSYVYILARYLSGYMLSYMAGPNGAITGESLQTVDTGGSGTAVTAVPDTGYHFVNWSDDSATNPRTDTNVTADISVTANFAKDNNESGDAGGDDSSSCFIEVIGFFF